MTIVILSDSEGSGPPNILPRVIAPRRACLEQAQRVEGSFPVKLVLLALLRLVRRSFSEVGSEAKPSRRIDTDYF